MARNELKACLHRNRPKCDICGYLLGLSVDMHESIVPRRVVQGWAKRYRDLIFVEENCHLLHHGACHMEAHADALLMVAIQITRYGKARIQEWIDSLPFKVFYAWDRGLTEEDAFLRVEAVAPWILEE